MWVEEEIVEVKEVAVKVVEEAAEVDGRSWRSLLWSRQIGAGEILKVKKSGYGCQKEEFGGQGLGS